MKAQTPPRSHGKALQGSLSGYWRYRIGNYRLIARIVDEELIIIAVSVAHRSKVYR
ncbi:type II toxin-antitoxin system RelE/ParE family toxin [Selenomonas artemidis]|uniref:type II toxin-antitoxin system RelE/ParE family toxin n=1 Tax=Selenomonas artemidis TaxID=671224 RepID=UPI00288A5120|nr:type II toxin-antitoxin system RelE/ParE family toxin [Selenomonas artemidis]